MTVVNKFIKVGDVNVFYREAGDSSKPKILLLHGFPSSSFQYRLLIPILAQKYHVISHDLPGYGFTEVPKDYVYTFENLTKLTEGFVDAIGWKKFAIYVHDYGAPTGFRLALDRPKAISAIISQNGNAFAEGFGAEFWKPIETYWKTGAQKDRDALRVALTLDSIKWQYTEGEKNAINISPETWWLDASLINTKPGNAEIQLDYLYDYRTNLPLYPEFQNYFKTYKPPILAIWGKHDQIFVEPGAHAYKTLVPETEVVMVDGGHFPLELHHNEIGAKIIEFLGRNDI